MIGQSHLSEIDRIRNSAGQMQIGEGSNGRIASTYALDDRLLVVRNDSVYAVQLADQIDPARTNPNIPNLNQVVFGLGSDSEIIKRTLLTAGELYRTPYLAESVDANRARSVSFDTILHLVAATEASASIAADVTNAIVGPTDTAYRVARLPAIGSPLPRAKSVIQRVEHAFQGLYRLGVVFYPGAPAKRNYFAGFRDLVREQEGEDSNFHRFATVLASNAEYIRNLRHCIEHENQAQRIIVKDFEMSSAGVIARPTVEIIHPHMPYAKSDLASFCTDLAALAIDAFESLAAHLANANINRSLPIPAWVGRAPADQQDPDRSDICYLVDLGGRIARLG